MIRVLDSAGSTLVEWGRQQQQQHDNNDHGDGNDDYDVDMPDQNHRCAQFRNTDQNHNMPDHNYWCAQRHYTDQNNIYTRLESQVCTTS